VEHDGVAEDNVRAVPDDPPLARGGVPVVNGGSEGRVRLLHQLEELGARPRLLEHRVQDGQVVAERLPARGRRDDDGVAALADVVERLRWCE
jgi:hypothetical protein